MVDKLIEDIVEVTETLMNADEVDIEAFAHPYAKPVFNKQLGENEEWAGWGNWGKHKAAEFKDKMKQQQHGYGIFKRGVC